MVDADNGGFPHHFFVTVTESLMLLPCNRAVHNKMTFIYNIVKTLLKAYVNGCGILYDLCCNCIDFNRNSMMDIF